MTADVARLFEVIDGTWPAARRLEVGPWCVREGLGGGQRVSAATATGAVTEQDIASAEAAMAGLGQPSIFMIRPGEEALDGWLADRGYAVVDPVNVYTMPSAALAAATPPVSTFEIWEPLAIMRDIWADGGIGPARIAVMARAEGPKTAIFGRIKDQPAGVAFVAGHGAVAMLHALEIKPPLRRHGLGRYMMWHAARWAQHQGLSTMSVICTQANIGANALYRGLGMGCVTGYHYRRITNQGAKPT